MNEDTAAVQFSGAMEIKPNNLSIEDAVPEIFSIFILSTIWNLP
ncbi:MAG TPA: hypothetical protein VGK10_17950 [Prolixibacteraceae bacterium]